MNTFLNIQDEFVFPNRWRKEYPALAQEKDQDKASVLKDIVLIPLQNRINNRGNREQYNCTFLTHYGHPSKRVCKSQIIQK